ncbi:Uracil-DNA glycosylase [Limnohabitans sp. 63ED37-2]|nr:uracil-DNA glycosylase [Limnohabitans sp. 63ED37-2]ALK90305.1 Uracil-DNA glycosylase [Limnohabitans sp. 63ED37-2]
MTGQQSLGFEEAPAVPDQALSWPADLQGLDAGWRPLVDAFLSSETGLALSKRLTDALQAGHTIYPPEPFRALSLTPLSEVRVVILGQDPYHGPGQAEGLAFSVAPGVRLPPSLRNIFKELQKSLGVSIAADGSLVRWAKQGVLLLNTCFTVEAGQAASHARWGWEVLSDQLIQVVAQSSKPVVFMLWGAQAQAKKALIEAAGRSGRHLVLMANHPSPLSALRAPVPFMGCGHFSQANIFLAQSGEKTIVW